RFAIFVHDRDGRWVFTPCGLRCRVRVCRSFRRGVCHRVSVGSLGRAGLGRARFGSTGFRRRRLRPGGTSGDRQEGKHKGQRFGVEKHQATFLDSVAEGRVSTESRESKRKANLYGTKPLPNLPTRLVARQGSPELSGAPTEGLC